jgi:hypothetical protein
MDRISQLEANMKSTIASQLSSLPSSVVTAIEPRLDRHQRSSLTSTPIAAAAVVPPPATVTPLPITVSSTVDQTAAFHSLQEHVTRCSADVLQHMRQLHVIEYQPKPPVCLLFFCIHLFVCSMLQ